MSQTTMTAAETTSHIREIMKTNIADHLREVHGITEPPKTKAAQNNLHKQQHAETPATDAASTKDASVVAGVTRKPEESKPATRTRKAAKAAPKPAAPETPAAKATAESNGKAPAEANGSSLRTSNQELAKRLVDLVAAEFGSESPENQVKIANWLKVLPTGGAAWERYWPAKFARPTTADWRKPE